MAITEKKNAKLTPLVPLVQGQPLGSDRFSNKICAATGIRHTQKGRGRPAGKPNLPGDVEAKYEFGF